MKTRRRANLLFTLLLIGYTLYGLTFIWQSSTVIEGKRYFLLFDDAMISMQYAKNLAAGHGAVWMVGTQPVEGYTNPLWVSYMALFHLLPIDHAVISVFIQLSGLLILLLNLIFVRRITDELTPESPLVGVLAAFLTATYFPLNIWAWLGLEPGILTLLLSVSVWLLIANLKRGAFSSLPYLILGLSTLIRLDAFVACSVVILVLALTDPEYRRRHLMVGLLSLVSFIGLQTLIRLAYYGDVLPNTYYLKVEGYPTLLRIGIGVYHFFNYVIGMNWLVWLLPFSVWLFRRDRIVVLLTALYAGQAAYSAYVGADMWETWGGANRFISVAMPLFFILMAVGLRYLYQAIFTALKGNVRRGRMLLNLASLVLIVLITVNLNSLNGEGVAQALLLKVTPHVDAITKLLRESLFLEKATKPTATLAVVQAGVISYFLDRPMYDTLGKGDRYIAHLPTHEDIGWLPGHMKWDYAYTFGQLKPDVIVQVWKHEEEAAPYLVDYQPFQFGERTMYFRKDSPNVNWDALQ